ncbi:MAG: biotin/lipoyl-containing protein [Dehalococcoidia bacterium]
MGIVDVLLPQSGMGMQDGEVIRWVKAVGDQVVENELIAEVEAAKALVEIGAPCDGELVEIAAQVGDVVEVQGVLGRIKTP